MGCQGMGRQRLSFLDARLPPAFELRVISIPSGGWRIFDEAEWRDALVVVERGAIELECLEGGRRRFGCGAVLCLVGLPLRALCNPAAEAAVLVAVSRRAPAITQAKEVL